MLLYNCFIVSCHLILLRHLYSEKKEKKCKNFAVDLTTIKQTVAMTMITRNEMHSTIA